MPRGVEQIDDSTLIGKLHDGSGDANTPLFLHLHPVRGRIAIRLLGLNRTRQLNSLSEQQKLFCNGGLTRVRVRDNRKGTSFVDLLLNHGNLSESLRKPRHYIDANRAGTGGLQNSSFARTSASSRPTLDG